MSKDNRKIMGHRLMLLRGDRTQKEVALAIGVCDCAIRNYESGRRVPTDRLKRVIAKYFKVSLEALFFRFDKPFIINNEEADVAEKIKKAMKDKKDKTLF